MNTEPWPGVSDAPPDRKLASDREATSAQHAAQMGVMSAVPHGVGEFHSSPSAPSPPVQWPYVLAPDAARIRADGGSASPPRRASVLAAVLAGGVVFIAVLAVGGLEFRSFARFRLDANLSERDIAAVRLKLLDFLLNLPGGDAPGQSAWMVQTEEGVLRFAASAATPRQSAALAKRLANEFAARIEEDAQALQQTPTRAEAFVGESLAIHRTRVVETGRRLSDARTQLPAVDPRVSQNELLQRWRRRKDALQSAATELSSSESRLVELRGSEPASVPADPVKVAEAERANLSLQQDLREMAVNLAEVHAELVQADEAAQIPLGAAADAAANLRYEAEHAALDHAGLPGVDALAATAAEYENQLTDLRKFWAEQASLLRDAAAAREPAASPQPSSGAASMPGFRRLSDTIDAAALSAAQGAMEKLTRDFAFAAEPRIREIERLAIALGDRTGGATTAGAGQQHEVVSTLLRAARTLAAEHRRVAFALAAATLADNFRLDAAMRSARALHARCRAIRQGINDQLAAEALSTAMAAWASAVASAEAALGDARAAHDVAVGELLAAHEELIESLRGAAGYVELLTRAEIDDAALRTGQEDLRRIEEQLDSLVQTRLAAARSPMSPAGIEIDPWPVNIVPRLTTSGTAAAATFFSMLLGQFWLTRRTSPSPAR